MRDLHRFVGWTPWVFKRDRVAVASRDHPEPVKRWLPAAARLLGPRRGLLAGLFALASPAAAQDVQNWSTLSVTAALGDGWRINGEVSGRTPAQERTDQLLLRVQAGRALGDRFVLWLGYVRAETLRDGARNPLDQRITAQGDWEIGTLGPLRVAGRTRVEGRTFRGSDGRSWRARQQLRLILPLGKVELAAGVEPFVALNRTANAPKTFEQLRFTGNLLVPLAKGAVLDVGYLNQHLYRADGHLLNHVVPVTLRLSF